MTVTSTRSTGLTDATAWGRAVAAMAVTVADSPAPADPTDRARCRRAARAALVEDVEWLAETGETRLRAARRVGMTTSSLQRALLRAGRGDLWRRLTGPMT